MFGTTFYHGYLRKYIALFGTLFNNIRIERTREDTTTQTIKVPMRYASQDKMITNVFANPDLQRPLAAFSPSISFEHGPPVYDKDRKLQSTLQRCIETEDGKKVQYIGVPYNIPFALYIYSKEEEDGLQVLEQILPYFTPAMQLTVEMQDELNYKVNVPIVLDDVEFQNESWGQFQDRRWCLWTLRFTLKGEFGGPVIAPVTGIIKKVYADIRSMNTRELMEEVYVQPGLTANGEPTTLETNSVPVTQINEDDDWGYVVQIREDRHP